MTTTVRKQKSGDQLMPGDWVAPGELLDGAAEVLFAHAYPASADRSRDNDGKHVQLVLREQGKIATYPYVIAGNTLFDLASDEDLAPLREKTERAQAIADLRAVAGAMERSPWLPMPHLSTLVHLYDDEGMRTVLALAERYGLPVDRHLDDRTEVLVPLTGSITLDVIAWHKDGRPASPAPAVPVPRAVGVAVPAEDATIAPVELLAIAPSADGGVAFALAPAGAVTDPVARAKVVELTEAVAASAEERDGEVPF